MAIFGRRQPHQPLILRPTVLGAATPAAPIGRNIAPHGGRNSQLAAAAARLPWRQPIILVRNAFPTPAIASPGWITQITRASIQAALAARRPLFRTLIAPRRTFLPVVPPAAGPAFVRGQLESIAGALQGRMPFLFRPTILRQQTYSVRVLPVAGPAFIRGQLESLTAATEARMPFIFRRFLGRPPFSLGPPPPPFPGPLGGIAPLLNRDPVQDVRLRRFTEILSSMYNSLVGRGYIRQDSPGVWSIQTGAFQVNRAPGINDDVTVDVLPGAVWINTASGVAYVNISNSAGAAVWAVIT